MEKLFINGNPNDGRDILIRIQDGIIFFYFYAQYKKRREWIKQEEELRLKYGIDKLTEEDKQDNAFYWIIKKEWDNDKTQRLDREDNWHTHMEGKNWFTKEMKQFIDNN